MPDPRRDKPAPKPSRKPRPSKPDTLPPIDQFRRDMKASAYGHVDDGLPTALVLSGGEQKEASR